MAYQAALSPQTLQQVYNYLRQARATGRVITNRDVRDAYEAALAAEARTNLLNRQISQQQENWQRQMDENTRRYNQEWANRMEQQERTSNAQNVLGGATLLASAPRIISGARELYGTGRDIYGWLTGSGSTPSAPVVTGAQAVAQRALPDALRANRNLYMQPGATSTEGTGASPFTSTPGSPPVGGGVPASETDVSVFGDSANLNPYAGMPALTDASSGMTSGLGGGLAGGAGATFGNLPTGYLAGGAGDVFGNLSPTFFSDTVTSGFGGDLGSLFSSWF